MTIKERHHKLLSTMVRIAAGKDNYANPMPGEASRQLARATLVAIGETWPKRVQYFKVESVNGEAALLPMDKERSNLGNS